MKKFIKVEKDKGEYVYINKKYIVSISKSLSEDYSVITTVNGSILVKRTIEEIYKLCN